MASFEEKLSNRIADTGARLCVGIDPRPEKMSGDLEAELERLVEETAPFAAAFKPNIAYFEAMGSSGFAMLERLMAKIPEEIPRILDAKRGDIGTTAERYADACFDVFGADAVTVNAYLGFDTVEPYLRHDGKAVYLLAVTSNPGAADLETQTLADGRKVFELVTSMAERASDLPGDLGFVVGLTNAEEVLPKIPDAPLLIPGLGAQGGDLSVVDFSTRKKPIVVNVSRGILFGEEGESYADRARRFAAELSTAAEV
ncbi:MAG: orotidine-5'-phosphate decarboxylase [Verrucomicrobiota bacterium]